MRADLRPSTCSSPATCTWHRRRQTAAYPLARTLLWWIGFSRKCQSGTDRWGGNRRDARLFARRQRDEEFGAVGAVICQRVQDNAFHLEARGQLAECVDLGMAIPNSPNQPAWQRNSIFEFFASLKLAVVLLAV